MKLRQGSLRENSVVHLFGFKSSDVWTFFQTDSNLLLLSSRGSVWFWFRGCTLMCFFVRAVLWYASHMLCCICVDLTALVFMLYAYIVLAILLIFSLLFQISLMCCFWHVGDILYAPHNFKPLTKPYSLTTQPVTSLSRQCKKLHGRQKSPPEGTLTLRAVLSAYQASFWLFPKGTHLLRRGNRPLSGLIILRICSPIYVTSNPVTNYSQPSGRKTRRLANSCSGTSGE